MRVMAGNARDTAKSRLLGNVDLLSLQLGREALSGVTSIAIGRGAIIAGDQTERLIVRRSRPHVVVPQVICRDVGIRRSLGRIDRRQLDSLDLGKLHSGPEAHYPFGPVRHQVAAVALSANIGVLAGDDLSFISHCQRVIAAGAMASLAPDAGFTPGEIQRAHMGRVASRAGGGPVRTEV